MPHTYRNTVKTWLARFGRFVFLRRPFGLAALGRDSAILRPRTLWGRDHINVGDDCVVLPHSLIQAVVNYEGSHFNPTIRIGNGVYIGRYAYLVASEEIAIEDGCVLSEHVYITDGNHGYDPHSGPIMQQPFETKGPVHIGPNCFLGYRVAVMPNVTLGEWCIVGANSVVTRSFPAYSMIAGAPARVVKVYSHEQRKWVAPPQSTKERTD